MASLAETATKPVEVEAPQVRVAPGYIRAVLRRMPPPLREQLNFEDWVSVLRTAEAVRTRAPHWVDWRFVIPLGFLRMYGVLQFGRDRRKRDTGADDTGINRRTKRSATFTLMHFLAAAFALGLLAVAALTVLFFLTYMMKEVLNIDINPGWSMLRDREVF